MNVCIYARVSTDDQELEQQIAACKNFCENNNLEVIDIFTDTGSGKNFMDRPGFFLMLKHIRQMKYAGLVCFRIDRLGRNLQEMLNFFQELENKRIRVFSLNENIDRETANGKLMLNIILSFAQYEREMISEATKERLKALKDAGMKLGRPIGSKDTKKRKKRRST